jgi:hypothetical protein
VEFTGVELATLVEKATTDLAQSVTASVEEAVHALEKAADRQEAWQRWRKAGSHSRLEA